MDLALYLNASEPDPRVARVVGLSDLSKLPLPIFTFGDRLVVSVYLVTSAGAYHADSTDATLSRTLTLGLRGLPAVAQTSTFTAITNGYRCTLDLNTTQLALFLLAARGGQLALVHKTTGSGPAPTTRCSLDCTVLGDVAVVDDGSPLSPTTYYNSAQVDALIAALVGTPFAITGLTGGTSADLDGFSSAALAQKANGTTVELYLSGGICVRYRLRALAGGEVEVGPASGGFLIICDADATRCWELLAVWKQGVPCTWNPDTAKWHQFVGTGTGTGVAPALAQEADAFSLPA